jgi:hypothetical protein
VCNPRALDHIRARTAKTRRDRLRGALIVVALLLYTLLLMFALGGS